MWSVIARRPALSRSNICKRAWLRKYRRPQRRPGVWLNPMIPIYIYICTESIYIPFLQRTCTGPGSVCIILNISRARTRYLRVTFRWLVCERALDLSRLLLCLSSSFFLLFLLNAADFRSLSINTRLLLDASLFIRYTRRHCGSICVRGICLSTLWAILHRYLHAVMRGLQFSRSMTMIFMMIFLMMIFLKGMSEIRLSFWIL